MADEIELSENERSQLDTEWMTTSAIRDGMVYAHGNPEDITYKQVFAMGHQVAPDLYCTVNRILDNPKESVAAQEIRQLARAQSVLEGKHITAVEYLEKEIAKVEMQSRADPEQNLVEGILRRYENIMQEIKPRDATETKLIFGDAERTGIGLPGSEGEGYKDYRLNKERILRVRVTHMEHPEAKIGADLVYENLNFKKKTAKIVIIQYKMWERYDQVIHWDPREQRQYDRMKGATCKSRLCDFDSDPIRAYRMPNCAAFVRPTDRLQEPSSRTVSSSLHVPVCVVDACWRPNQNNGKSIRRGQIEDRSLSHKVFGELFDNCMVGSKEITWEEMTTLYRGYKIFEANDRVMVHMQDTKLV